MFSVTSGERSTNARSLAREMEEVFEAIRGSEHSEGVYWRDLSPDQVSALQMIALQACGVPSRFWGVNFEGSGSKVEARMDATAKVADTGIWNVDGALIAGPHGCGKTCMVVSALKTLFGAWSSSKSYTAAYKLPTIFGKRVRFTTLADLLETLCSKDVEGVDETVTLKTAHLVVVDDIVPTIPVWQLEKFSAFIAGAYDRHQVIWATTNSRSAEMKRWDGWGQITSRFGDKKWMRYYEMTESDRRRA